MGVVVNPHVDAGELNPDPLEEYVHALNPRAISLASLSLSL